MQKHQIGGRGVNMGEFLTFNVVHLEDVHLGEVCTLERNSGYTGVNL